jgi:hypothetical protein
VPTRFLRLRTPPPAAAAVSPDRVTATAWEQRTLTVIGQRDDLDQACFNWRAADWNVIAVDAGPPTDDGRPTHLVRVAIPPAGWTSMGTWLHDLSEHG